LAEGFVGGRVFSPVDGLSLNKKEDIKKVFLHGWLLSLLLHQMVAQDQTIYPAF
jgi:hypothetical protein